MDSAQKVLFIDPSTGFYKMKRYGVGDFFGPVDLGLHLSGKLMSINIGTGLFAGSILPGSNRLMVTGFSPCWRGFYISSMGGAGLVFDNLGVNMVSIVGKAPVPSVICLNRVHGEEVEVIVEPCDITSVWNLGENHSGGNSRGSYALMEYCLERFGSRYETDPRVLATGPASLSTDFGGILSAPVSKGKISPVDTWAGRGGMGSKLLQEHGIAGIIYGGTFLDEDFRDRTVADKWFIDKYQQKLVAKDFESTTKYRFEPKFQTGGTFGVNFATLGGRMMAFNYRTIYETEEARVSLHRDFVLEHYLPQFNDETIIPRHQSTCGEPCSAVCKKMREEFKKDYEPYQTFGPLCGIFDQRGAENAVRKADEFGFDAISAGGVTAWMMDLLDTGEMNADQLGVSGTPKFSRAGFDVAADSMKNSALAVSILESIVEKRGMVDLSEGARKWGRRMSRLTGKRVLDSFVYTAFGRRGWMVPNQYWTAGALAPMGIMGKYYMHYGTEFIPPRKLGNICAERLVGELVMDNAGVCRFHRGWAEEMIPQIVGELFGKKEEYLNALSLTGSRINSRNVSVFWETERTRDFVRAFLKRKREVDGDDNPELLEWIDRFDADTMEGAREFWYEMRKGIDESLSEFA